MSGERGKRGDEKGGKGEGTRFVLRLFSSLLVPSLPPPLPFSFFPSPPPLAPSFFFSSLFSGVHGARVYSEHASRGTRDGAEYLEFNDPRWERGRCAMGGYSLDETHIPEIVACLIPALASADDYDAAAKTDPSLSRVASLESVTDNALLIGNS